MQNSKCGVTIPAVYACGMHHYGTSAFEIDVGYILQREPSNAYDPNAIVVTRKNKPMAHIMRAQSDRLAPIMDSKLLASKVYIKFKEQPEVKVHRIGPQQLGNVGFYCIQANKAELFNLCQRVGLQYKEL